VRDADGNVIQRYIGGIYRVFTSVPRVDEGAPRAIAKRDTTPPQQPVMNIRLQGCSPGKEMGVSQDHRAEQRKNKGAMPLLKSRPIL